MSEMNSNCFVIMPFSKSSENHTEGYWTEHFNKILKPTIEELGVKTSRVEATREDIIIKIIHSLVTSPIVLADLTDHNPNVFWELGVRQSFKQNTITIAEEGTELPFDVSPKATIFYNITNEEQRMQFKLKLKEAIKDCMTNPEKSDSHVLESISGRGSLYEIMRLDRSRRRIESLIVEAQSNYRNYIQEAEIVAQLKDFSRIPFILKSAIWRSRCLEFLFVNRYLDEDDKFYNTAEFVLRLFEALQVQTPMLNSLNAADNKNALNYLRGRYVKQFSRVIKIWIESLEKTYQNIIKKMQTMVSKTRFKSLNELKSVVLRAEYGSWNE